MSAETEMPIIVAMSQDAQLYRHGIDLHVEQMLSSFEAKDCFKQFHPQTGEFDMAGIPKRSRAAFMLHAASNEFHTQFTLEKAVSRLRLEYQAKQVAEALKADCPDEQLNKVASTLSQLGQLSRDEEDNVDQALADIDRIANGQSPLGVMGWPIPMLRKFGMIHSHELIIIGGRPGSGKSALMGQIAYEFAKAQQRVLYISLEMGKLELRHRWTALEVGASVNRVHLRPELHARYKYAFQQIANNDHLLVRERYSIAAILSEIATQATQGLAAVFIDYLQLIQGDGSRSRLEQLSDITRQLKLSAKQLGVPVFAGSQLNRQSEHQERPSLSSLRESGSIEQDADRVLLLHRDDAQGCTEIIQAKLRNGPQGMVQATFSGETTSFSPLTTNTGSQ